MLSRKMLLGTVAASTILMLPKRSDAKTTSDARLVVFYNTPVDQVAFDKYYFDVHAPLASKIPGLRSYVVSKSPVFTPDGKPSATYSFFAELGFDSVAAIESGLASPEGAATVADLKNFADAGVQITMFDTKTV